MSDCDQAKMDNLPTREEYELEKRKMMYPYRSKCKEVLRRFEEGLITEEEALDELREIEETAYDKIPNAEPDGDITYCVAMTVEEIKGS